MNPGQFMHFVSRDDDGEVHWYIFACMSADLLQSCSISRAMEDL